jgi:hypothetical protein
VSFGATCKEVSENQEHCIDCKKDDACVRILNEVFLFVAIFYQSLLFQGIVFGIFEDI